MGRLSPYPATLNPHTSLRLSAFWELMRLSKERSPPVISFSFTIKKDTREQLCGLKNLFSFRLSFLLSFLFPFLLLSTSSHSLKHTHTGATGNSKFPFMLLIIGACRYFMRPCKPLNYCTLKCILTLLRDHVDGKAFHCWSEDLKWWTTKEHDLLIIFNCRIKMIMK